ncbi:MAG: extracellular solute-binding protein [Anaerolineae bacterium]
MSKKVFPILSLLVIAAMMLVACAPAATPEKVVETVVVEKEKTVVETVEVEKEVAGQVFNIEVWAEANAVEHWRADAPMKAASLVNKMFEEQGRPERVTVDGLNDDAGWGDYKKKFTLAADAGEAPHIVLSGHEDVPVWANAGYIEPFDKCREMYPEFDDVIDSLWFAGEWNGQIWAVPQDTEARPMFFNKTKLKELGWSDEDIAALPEKIKNGEWTLDDLIATAKEAIDKGVVEPGYGYWHRPSKGGDFLQYYFAFGGYVYEPAEDKLVVVKDALTKWYQFQRRVVEEGITPENFIGTEWSIWHDTVSHGNALFWNGGIWQWADWAENYVKDLGGQDYLFEHVGFALQPAGEPGQKAGTLSHPLVYMITTESASGDKDYYDLACAVLAKTTTPELNTLHAVGSTHLGILKSQATYEEYANDRLLSQTLYMLDHNYYQPNHVMYGPYYDVVFDFMVKAENGELAPDVAAEQAIQQLQVELADVLIVK